MTEQKNDLFEERAPRTNLMSHIGCHPSGREILLTDGDTVSFHDSNGEVVPQRRIRFRILNPTDVVALEVCPATLATMSMHFISPEALNSLLSELFEGVDDLPESLKGPGGQTVSPDTPDEKIPHSGIECEISATTGGSVVISSGETVWRDPEGKLPPQRRMSVKLTSESRVMSAEVGPSTLIAACIQFLSPVALMGALQKAVDYHEKKNGNYESIPKPDIQANG